MRSVFDIFSDKSKQPQAVGFGVPVRLPQGM
jgi:hypothetical protein